MGEAFPTRIGSYEIHREIGRGGMGVVYLARDTKLERDVAIKALPADMADDANRLSRFEREAKTLASLNHPNIASIFGLEEADGRQYIILEHVAGETLADRLARGAMPVHEAIPVARQVAAAIESAHENGVIHRDIKPANIKFSSVGEIKVLDFGLAKALERNDGPDYDSSNASTIARSPTLPGLILGTPGYLSPEQARGRPVDQRTDIFAFGSVLYEMLTGAAPFAGESVTDSIGRTLHADPDWDALPAETPDALRTLLKRCLAKDCKRRLQSIGDARVEIEEVAAGASGGTTGPMWLVAGIASILLLAAVMVYAMTRESEQPLETTARPKLVVLPFRTIGEAPDDVISAALTEELTNRLSTVSGLKVIARFSADQYADRTKTLRQIGDELDVDYVLDPSITWGGSRDAANAIRVSVQLVSIADESVPWSDSYDQVADDVLSVQRDIVPPVVAALNLHFGEADDAPGTENMAAWSAFVRGQNYARMPDPHLESNKSMAVQMFSLAVKHDPRFARAWAELAWAHGIMYLWGHDQTDERLDMLRDAVDEALAIDPDLPEAYIALGLYHQCRLEFVQSLEQYALAARSLPNDSRVLMSTAVAKARLGDYDEAEALIARAMEVNPLDAYLPHELGDVFMFPKRFREAEAFYNYSIQLAPDQVLAYTCQAENFWLQGRLDDAYELIRSMPKRSDPRTIRFQYRTALFYGRYQEAIDCLNQIEGDVIMGHWWYKPKAMLAAAAYGLLGQSAKAQSLYEESVGILETAIAERPKDTRIRQSLGVCYAHLGRPDEALREGRACVEQISLEDDMLAGAKQLAAQAAIFTAAGKLDQATENLERLLAMPSDITPQILRVDPRWRSLQGYPPFEAVMAKYGSDGDVEQRPIIDSDPGR
ncbi:MAG: protein kinase domain-containing protein [Planctomycetota bacterium]|jgi:TolB-like protein/Flp pilus assembly protein TadD